MRRILIAVIAMSVFGAAVAQAQTVVDSWSETIRVESFRQYCEGVVPKACLVVQRENEIQYRPMLDEIENFRFVPGYEYELRVQIDKVRPVAKDTSGLRFYLKEIVGRHPVKGNDRLVHLFGKKWRLSSIRGKEIPDTTAFIVFSGADGGVYGYTGCNSFRGSFSLDEDLVRLSKLMMTKRVCSDPVNAESRLVEALAAVRLLKAEPDRLYLQSEGKTVLVFKAKE